MIVSALANHFWIVGDDLSRVWSSRDASYKAADDVDYLAFLALGSKATCIRNEFELQEALLRVAPAGAMAKTFTPAEALEALAIIDEAAVLQAFGAETLNGITPDAETLIALRDQFGLAAVSIA